MDFELLIEALVKIAERRYGVKLTYKIADRADVEKREEGESECHTDANGSTRKYAMGVWNAGPIPATIAPFVGKKCGSRCL